MCIVLCSWFCFQIISESIIDIFGLRRDTSEGTYTDCSCSLPYYSNYFVYEYVSCWFARILLRFDWSARQRCRRVHESYGGWHTNGCHQTRQWRNYDLTIRERIKGLGTPCGHCAVPCSDHERGGLRVLLCISMTTTNISRLTNLKCFLLADHCIPNRHRLMHHN